MKLDVELRDEKINGLQRELEELQMGGTSEVRPSSFNIALFTGSRTLWYGFRSGSGAFELR